MNVTDLVISPLAPALGVEITALELDLALDDAMPDSVYKALIHRYHPRAAAHQDISCLST